MGVEVQAVPVQGYCDERFAEVEEEFRRNFAERGELGASVAVRLAGETVADLWGGFADEGRERAWDEDASFVLVFSCTKGAVSLCAHMLAAAAGGARLRRSGWRATGPNSRPLAKEGVLVRHLLSHQAGLPAIRSPLAPGAFYDWDHMIEVLAAEEPFWTPGSTHGYHGLTLDFSSVS